MLALSLLAGCATAARPASRTLAQPCGAGLDKLARVGALDLAYRQYGPRGGAPMILIGGTGQQLIDWPQPMVAGLAAKGYRVIVFDNRDVGCSTHMTAAGPPDYGEIVAALRTGAPAPVAYSLETLADDTRGLMDALGLRQAHIVGISGGAIVGEIFAAKYPGRTLSLSAIAANSGNKAYSIPADSARFAAMPAQPPANASRQDAIAYRVATMRPLQSRTYPESDETLRAQSAVDIDRRYDPDGGSRQSAAALVTPDLRDRLRTISAPTVVIQGDEDPLIPRALAQDVADTIPGARFVLVHGMGHDLPAPLTPDLVAAIQSVARPHP